MLNLLSLFSLFFALIVKTQKMEADLQAFQLMQDPSLLGGQSTVLWAGTT